MSTTDAWITRPVIAGNWKMNHSPEQARAFCRDFRDRVTPDDQRTVILFPTALALPAVVEELRDRPDIGIGVQNIHWEDSGAFTGEISAPMARDAGATFALVGHSERRHIFGESDEDVGRKTAAALRGGLVPVACVGETLEEREGGRLQEVLLRQLDAILDAMDADAGFILAYEPVWAIGTGVNATPADASDAHALLRGRLAERIGEERAANVPILYGGSVKPENAAQLLGAPDVDGVLVGGASLDPEGFAKIVDQGMA